MDSNNYAKLLPRAICACGHTGDGANSQHEDSTYTPGHGRCKECNCIQFSWRKWVPEFEDLLKKDLELEKPKKS